MGFFYHQQGDNFVSFNCTSKVETHQHTKSFCIDFVSGFNGSLNKTRAPIPRYMLYLIQVLDPFKIWHSIYQIL